jgi:hypothetical protein
MVSRSLFPSLVCILWIFFSCLPLPVSAATVTQNRKPTSDKITATYVNSTLTEDTSWSGIILVKGSVVVASQATLRIEPGTVIRFVPLKGSRQLPRLVVMGRIQGIGTADRPILFAPNLAIPGKGDWGGVLLLSSEKRNQFEHCRIEGAETGLEGRFSIVTTKAVTITSSKIGCLLRDSIANLSSTDFTACDTGVEVYDSEVELRDSKLAANHRGMSLFRSAVVMSSVVVTGSTQQALMSEDCRLKISSCEISENSGGALIKGGEGQLFLSRFVRNRDTALHLVSARLKISRCQISYNMRDGLKLESDLATIWGNAITNNGGFNMIYGGQGIVNVTQNWWGSNDELTILSKLSATAVPQRSDAVNVFPWLAEKPVISP